MALKLITQFLRHGVVYRVGFLNFNNTLALSSKKSDSMLMPSPKLAIFEGCTIMLHDILDDRTMVLLKLKNPTR